MNNLAWPIATIDYEETLHRLMGEYLLTVIDEAKRSYYSLLVPLFEKAFGVALCHQKRVEYSNDWECRGTD